MKLKDIIKQVSQENNLPEEVVTLAYKSYWKFIKDTIQELPLKEDLSEEEFNKRAFAWRKRKTVERNLEILYGKR